MDPLLRPPAPGPAASGASTGVRLPSHPHRVVWERAADLAVDLFRLTAADGPIHPALRTPLRAAALAVPTFLARAFGGAGRVEARGHLIRALGALAEVESHLALAVRLSGEAAVGVAELRGRIEVARRLVLALGTRELPARLPPRGRQP